MTRPRLQTLVLPSTLQEFRHERLIAPQVGQRPEFHVATCHTRRPEPRCACGRYLLEWKPARDRK